MKRTNSIIFRTVILLSLPLSAIFVIIGILTNAQIDGIYSQIVKRDISLVRARSEHIGALMNEVSDYTKSLRALKAIREGNPVEQREAMRNIRHWMPKNVSDVLCVTPDGNFLSSGGNSGSIADREYFQEIKDSGADDIMSDAIVSKIDGSRIFVVLARLTSDEGEFTGYVGCQIKLEILSTVCRKISFGKSGYGWMIDDAGLVVAHKDDSLVGTLDLAKADAEGGYRGLAKLGEAMTALSSTTPGEVGYFAKPDGKSMITFYTKIVNTRGWTIALTVSDEEYFAAKRSIIGALIAFLAGCLAVSALISYLIAKSIARPVMTAQRAFEQLAEGDADLTAKIRFKGRHEVGELVGAFNRFLDKLLEIVVALKDEQAKLDRISGELRSNIGETTDTISDMTGTIGEVARQTRKQGDLTNDSSAGVNEIAANIESLDNMIASQASSITEASSAIEQMIHNIASITNSMSRLSAEFSLVAESSAAGKGKIAETTGLIGKIVDRSATLLEVNKTIAKIAAQTNLLAMNAAIESAHAGDAGRGFAVVADEIRRLAEDSQTQSKIISKELAEVQRAISEVAEVSRESVESFAGMEARIGSTDGFLKEINRALDEQSEGSKQILLALKEMNDISSEVRNGAGEMRAGNESILSAMNSLKSITNDIGEEMGKLAEKSGDLSGKTGSLSQIAEVTAEAVAGMERSIGKFKS
jgi:methyl-accepting chemotaxis protein